MEIHPVAELFPPMNEKEFSDLKADIAQNGQLEPIIVHKGRIIDGRNRYKACTELGITPQFKDWGCIGSLISYVVSRNLHRRHLSESQRAMVGARLKTEFEKEGFERKRQNGRINGGRGKKQEVENLPSPKAKSRDLAAKEVNVSGRTIDKAKNVIKKGTPRLVEGVENGEISVHLASQIAQLPYEDQIKLLNDPNSSIFKRLARNLSRRQMESRVRENQIREIETRKNLPCLDKRFKLYTRDLKDGVPEIADNSIDLIVCDPPYKSRFISCYDYLGAFAARTLKYGGSLLVLCGQHHLYEEMTLLNKHLKYYWVLSYNMLGGKSGIGKQRNVFIRWKPVLWYTKGVYSGGFVTDLCSPVPEKQGKMLHIWEQPIAGIRSIIEKFAKTGMVICDPMTGSSSVGVIAIELNCFFLGIDKSQTCIDISRSRLIDKVQCLAKK